MELKRFAQYRVVKNPAAAALRVRAPSLAPGEVVRFLIREGAIKESFEIYTFTRVADEEDFLRIYVDYGEKFDLAEYFEFVSAL